MNELSIYCDESHPIKHDGTDFFIIGCIYCNKLVVKDTVNVVNSLKRKYGYKDDYEVKWSKINGKNIQLVKEMIRYCFLNPEISLRILIATNKEEKKFLLKLKHDDFYKAMYHLLLSKIKDIPAYSNVTTLNLLFDERNSHSKTNASEVGRNLKKKMGLYQYNCQCLDSSKEVMIQLVDLFLGATSYEREKRIESKNKLEVIEYIKKLANKRTLNWNSKVTEQKYNIFIWNGEKIGENKQLLH